MSQTQVTAPNLPPDIATSLIEFGRAVLADLGTGATLAEWENRMVEDLGAGVRPHLQVAWDTIHPSEEQKTMRENKTPRGSRVKRWLPVDSGALVWFVKRAMLWIILIAAVFALGLVWTGGLYRVEIVKGNPSVQTVYRVNRLTGAIEVCLVVRGQIQACDYP